MKAEPVKWQVEAKSAAETLKKHLMENLSFKQEYMTLVTNLEGLVIDNRLFKATGTDTANLPEFDTETNI